MLNYVARTDVLDPGDLTGPFLGGQAVSEGWLSKEQLYSPLFRRLFHRVHVPAGIPLTHELRCAAAALVAPPDAVLTGCSAAVVRGFGLVTEREPVEFIVPERARFIAQRGMHIRRTKYPDIDSEPWRDIGLATPLRMAFDILINTRLHRSLPRVVGLLDVLVRGGAVDLAALATFVKRRHDHGVVRARKALELADSRAESIPESELRVWLRLGGLEPEVQFEVYERGLFLGRLDLAFPRCKLAVEYDGEWHGEGDQPRLDAERRARMRAVGWDFVVVTKDQLYGDPAGVVDLVRDQLARKRAHFRDRRRG